MEQATLSLEHFSHTWAQVKIHGHKMTFFVNVHKNFDSQEKLFLRNPCVESLTLFTVNFIPNNSLESQLSGIV